VEDCAVEPAVCKTSRCTDSKRVRQLWYFSKSSGQLLSSFTDTAVPPVVVKDSSGGDSGGDSARSRRRAAAAAVGIINQPKCLSSSPNTSPPPPPPAPADVDASLPLQVWAGKLTKGRVAVILSNAGSESATVTANWGAIGLTKGAKYTARDAVHHKSAAGGPFSDTISATVASHDVVVYVLTPHTA